MPGFRFPRKFRLCRRRDFERVFEQRTSVADQWLIVYGCKNNLDYSRLGISVPRKLGKATVRNRVKRYIRESFRLKRPDLPAGIDLVVIPRSGEGFKLGDLQRSLVTLVQRLARRLNECPSQKSEQE